MKTIKISFTSKATMKKALSCIYSFVDGCCAMIPVFTKERIMFHTSPKFFAGSEDCWTEISMISDSQLDHVEDTLKEWLTVMLEREFPDTLNEHWEFVKQYTIE